MSEMVKQVATAICKSRTCEGMMCCQWPAQLGRTKCPVKDGAYDDAARASIAALRIPTDDMIDAGDAAGMTATVRTATVAIWTAMVKEALR